jgi:hypothetical protein
MIKITTLILLSLSLSSLAHGQCVPNAAYNTPGIYPDSASGFPPAVATYEYNLVITAVIPFDTIVFPLPRLPVDSIGMSSITGLPAGFEAIPNRPSGYWLGGTSGCMLITGTPAHDQVGHYPLVIEVVGYMGGLGFPFPYEITFYSITILDSTAYGIRSPQHSVFSNISVYPNPFSSDLNLTFYTQEPGSYDCLIYDSMSRLLVAESIQVVAGNNAHRIDGSALKPGLYSCMIRHKSKNFSSVVKLLKY